MVTTFKRTVPGLLPTSRYIVRVRAVSPLGVASDWAEAAVVKSPPDSSIPSPPGSLTYDFNSPDLRVSWAAPTTNTDGSALNDLSHYRITLASPAGVETFDTFSTSYTYTLAQNRANSTPPQPVIDVSVVAIDKFFQESTPVITTATHTRLHKPPAPRLSSSVNSVTIEMSPAQDAAAVPPYYDGGKIVRYRVEHSVDNLTWAEIGVSISGVFTHSVTSTDPQYYRYYAQDFFERLSPVSDSTSTTAVQFPGPDGNVPPKVAVPTVRGGPGFLFAKWVDVTNADQVYYEVHLGTVATFVPDPPVNGTSTTYITGGIINSAFIKTLPDGNPLTYGTNYYIKVVAFDEDGRGIPSDASLAVQMVKVGTADVGNQTISLDQLADGSINAQKLVQQAFIGGNFITTDAIGTTHLVANAVTGGKIAADSVGATQMIAGSITATNGIIASLDASKITTGTMSANYIYGGDISGVSITGNTINGGSITGANFYVDASYATLRTGPSFYYQNHPVIEFQRTTAGGGAWAQIPKLTVSANPTAPASGSISLIGPSTSTGGVPMTLSLFQDSAIFSWGAVTKLQINSASSNAVSIPNSGTLTVAGAIYSGGYSVLTTNTHTASTAGHHSHSGLTDHTHSSSYSFSSSHIYGYGRVYANYGATTQMELGRGGARTVGASSYAYVGFGDTTTFCYTSTGAQGAINASNVSKREKKRDIVPVRSVLDQIIDTTIYQFRYKEPPKDSGDYGFLNTERTFTGPIWDEAPQDIRWDDNISTHDMTSFVWKGLQEEDAKVEELKKLVLQLQERINELESR